MDILGVVDVPIWLLGILISIVSLCLYTRYKQTYFTRNGYVQKETLLFLGDLREITTKGLGYINHNLVKKYGKVFGAYIGSQPSLVINDAEMIKVIFVKDFSNFTERGTFIPVSDKWKSVVSIAEGSHWKFLRNVISPTFSSGKMRQMKPYLKRCLDQFHEIIEEHYEKGEDFDMVPDLKGYTMDVICSTGFGMDVHSQRDPDNLFIKYAREVLEFNGTRSLAFLTAKPTRSSVFLASLLQMGLRIVEITSSVVASIILWQKESPAFEQIFLPDFTWLQKLIGPSNVISKEAFEFFDRATRASFEDRKKSSSNHKDLLQLMINAHKDTGAETNEDKTEGEFTLEDFKKRGLTDTEVLMNSLIFMVAGFDTTATTLSWLVYDMMVNPEVQDILIDEIDREIGQEEPTYDSIFKMGYLDMVVNETLRMHPPVTRNGRVANNDTEVCGVKIPKGMLLAFYPLAIHFMEEYWDKPFEYKPERFAPENRDNINEYAYMPFGLGPRNCVGMRLALLEVKMTLVSILQKYKIHKSDKLTVPMPASKIGLHKPEDPLYVCLEKREI